MPSRRFGVRQSISIIWTIGWSDFLLKYHGSVLGYLWSLVSPVVKFLVILHVFRPLVGDSIAMYPMYLFLGIIMWEHFSYTTSGCMNMLFEKAEVIQRVPFPRLLLVLIVGWTQAIVFATYLIVFFLFALVYQVPLDASSVYMLLIVVQMTLLALGIGMILSAWSLKYRDIGHLWAVGLQVLFWLTPIVYGYTMQRSFLRDLVHSATQLENLFSLEWILRMFIQFQPLSVLINDARRAMLGTSGTPTVIHALAFTVLCGGIFAVGAWIFVRRSKSFIQEY
jgi:ABC-2 type transport system permease protein